jgi:hypothetical protein
MRTKVIKFCMQKDWKVTDQDAGDTPNFDEIKKFLEHEIHTLDVISVYERDRCDSFPAISYPSACPTVSSPKPVIIANSSISHSSDPSTVPFPKPAVPANPATPNSIPVIVSTTPAPAPAPAPAPVPASNAIATIPTSSSRRISRVSRCIWCDSPDHSREYSSFNHLSEPALRLLQVPFKARRVELNSGLGDGEHLQKLQLRGVDSNVAFLENTGPGDSEARSRWGKFPRLVLHEKRSLLLRAQSPCTLCN